jgi:hypothetical protein
VAAGSATLLKGMQLDHLHPDFSSVDGGDYGIPFNVVGSDTSSSSVTFDYADESDHVGYPIPSNPKIEDASDGHLLMVDTDACKLYELYQADDSSGSWHAGSGAVWDLRSNALRPAGWTSADAAGLPIFPGLARYDEVAGAGIDHALRVTMPVTQQLYLWPARHQASSVTAPWTAPMGLRLRLKSSFDISGFGPQARAILTAVRDYGLIVADNGSAGYISGAPDAGWNDDDLHALQQVPASALEVVDTSALPGTPTRGRVVHARFDRRPHAIERARFFHTRAGGVAFEALRHGRVVSSRRFSVRMGFVVVTMRAVTQASYRVRAL